MLRHGFPSTVMVTVWLPKTAASGNLVPVRVMIWPPLVVTELGATAVKVGGITTAAGVPVVSMFP